MIDISDSTKPDAVLAWLRRRSGGCLCAYADDPDIRAVCDQLFERGGYYGVLLLEHRIIEWLVRREIEWRDALDYHSASEPPISDADAKIRAEAEAVAFIVAAIAAGDAAAPFAASPFDDDA